MATAEELAALEAARQEKAEAIGAFEAEYAAAEAEWKAKRVAANQAYQEADRAFQDAASQSGPDAPEAQTIEPDGVVAGAESGEVG